jgi:ribosomal protein L17
MAKINIDEFLSTGSPKDVILLYFTYLAGSNISNYTGDEDLLNPEQIKVIRTEIQRIVKDKKHKDYFSNLVIANRSFLYMYPHIVGLINGAKHYNSSINNLINLTLSNKRYENTVNTILEQIEDRDLRKKIFNKIASNYMENEAISISKDYDKYIQLRQYDNDKSILLIIEDINRELPIAKDYIMKLKSFLKKYLPLKPYRDFINSQEKDLLKTTKNSIESISKYIDIKNAGIPEEQKYLLTDNYKIIPYNEIEIVVSDEYLKALKLAGQ